MDSNATAIARYLSGESTAAESALVEAWIASDPRRRAEFEEIRRAWSASFPLELPIDLDGAWLRVADGMRQARDEHFPVDKLDRSVALQLERTPIIEGADELRLPHHPRSSAGAGYRFTRARNRMGLLAAAVALLVLGATGVYREISARSIRPDNEGRTTRNFVAAAGQRALIDLEDGTHIVLAPSTHLTVSMPKNGPGLREVMLDGEAIFTVTHDSVRPFVVRSRYGSTMDIGTSFAVRAYANERYRVAVRDGKVAIGRSVPNSAKQDGSGASEFVVDRATPVLVAGDVAIGSDDGRMTISHGQDVAELLDWSSGRLTFDHKAFAELAPELERWYGVQIVIADSVLRRRPVTGQFDTESRSEVFDALGRALGARHTVSGSRVTFFLP